MENFNDLLLQKLDLIFTNIDDMKTYINKNFNEIKTDISEIRTDVNELRSEVNEIRTEVNELRTEVNELRSDVNKLTARVDQLIIDFNTLKDRFDVFEFETKNKLDILFDAIKLQSDNVNKYRLLFEKDFDIINQHSHRIFILEKNVGDLMQSSC